MTDTPSSQSPFTGGTCAYEITKLKIKGKTEIIHG